MRIGKPPFTLAAVIFALCEGAAAWSTTYPSASRTGQVGRAVMDDPTLFVVGLAALALAVWQTSNRWLLLLLGCYAFRIFIFSISLIFLLSCRNGGCDFH